MIAVQLLLKLLKSQFPHTKFLQDTGEMQPAPAGSLQILFIILLVGLMTLVMLLCMIRSTLSHITTQSYF